MDYIYRADVTKHKVEQPTLKTVMLFGREYQVYDDNCRNHLHIIPTFRCNAKCAFCIEKGSICGEVRNFQDIVTRIMEEMQKAGILHTVSFTGGEPAMYEQLAHLIQKVPINIFTTMNTNGFALERTAGFGLKGVNLSRHYIDENRNREVFRCKVPTLKDVQAIRQNTDSLLRLQAIVNKETRLEDYLELIDKGVCHDVSFRSLMLDGSEESRQTHELYLSLIDTALNMGSEVLEQELQDYYVYEVHKIGGKLVTFSYSNMEFVLNEDKQDQTNFIREFILRPDGTLSGSWDIGKKIIGGI